MEIRQGQTSCCAHVDYVESKDDGGAVSEDKTHHAASEEQTVLPNYSEGVGLTEEISKECQLRPPPQLEYPSEVEAESAIHQWTLRHGYTVTKKQLERNHNGDVVYRLFACDQCGNPKNTRRLADRDRVRLERRSLRSGCPKRIKIVAVDQNDPTGAWKIVHTRDGSHIHNHGASQDPRVHVTHRQRAGKLAQTPNAQTINEVLFSHEAASIFTSKIYAALLHTDNDTTAIPQDISNIKTTRRRKLLDSKSVIDALVELLQEKGFHYYFETEPTCNSPDTVTLAHDFLDVLIMDCTYKTNEYKNPLLNIITVTGMNTTLPIAQCWLPGESTEDYTWDLSTMKKVLMENRITLPRVIVRDRALACMNATDIVFPSATKLVCRWHVNRNVEARVQNTLGVVKLLKPDLLGRTKMNTCRTNAFLEEFHSAMHSETEEDFEARTISLRRMESSLADYLGSTWWRYKEKLLNIGPTNTFILVCSTHQL